MPNEEELLKSIDEKLTKLLEWRATMDERCQNRLQILKAHQKTLFGDDGLDGIVSQTNLHTDFITNTRKWQMTIFGGVIVSAIISVAAALISMWKANPFG